MTTKRKRLATIYRGHWAGGSVKVAIDGKGRVYYRDKYRSGCVKPGLFAGFTNTMLWSNLRDMVDCGMPSPIATLIYRQSGVPK